MTEPDDLATRYMPDGVELDETNRHAAGQLAIAWLSLSPDHRRLIVEFERVLNPGKAAANANVRNSAGAIITHGEAADLLGTTPIRRVMHLRSLMREDTIPPPMIGRILSRIALGMEDASAHAKIRACTELARVQGAYVPLAQVGKTQDDAGAEGLDQAAKDRIVAGAMWPEGMDGAGQSFADLLRARAKQADAEEMAAQEAAADAAAVESIVREDAAAKAKEKRKKYKRRYGEMPIIGTVPEPLANTDALYLAKQKMAIGGGNG